MEPTILIVDDSPLVRRNLRTILCQAGYTVIAEAEDGVRAEELYRLLHPTGVFMDLEMPGLDGLSAIRRICRWDPQARIIVCTSRCRQDAVIAAIRSGAMDFVAKPFDSARVVSAADRLVRGAQAAAAAQKALRLSS